MGSIYRYISRMIFFVLGAIIIYWLLGIAIIDDNTSTRLKFHEFYAQSNIDVAIVGASRANIGFDPVFADTLLGEETFNLATASQTTAGSYYLLKELINRNDVKTVFLEVEFSRFSRDPNQQKSNWIVFDYMEGYVKYQYITEVFDKSEWLGMMSRVCRYKDNISIDWCLKNLKAKFCKDYWMFSYNNDVYDNYSTYQKKGLYILPKANPGMDFFVYKRDFSEFDKIDEEENLDTMDYIYKSIELCQENDIEIVLVTFPESQFYLKKAGDYSHFIDRMLQITDTYGVDWIDLNRIEGVVFEDDEFSNLDHLTLQGAKHCTQVLCDIYSNPDKYTVVDNPLGRGKSEIVGVTYDLENTENGFKLTWDVESYLEGDYIFRVTGYNEDRNLMFDTDFCTESYVIIDSIPHEMYIEIYDLDYNLIGKGKFT